MAPVSRFGDDRRRKRAVAPHCVTVRSARNRHGGHAMPHLLDPKRLDKEATYLAAIDELAALMEEESDALDSHRIDELFALIEDYEFRHGAARAPAD
jgi:hypothetical protein